MLNLIIIMFIFSLITMILIFISILISKKKIFDREKFSPFECGFDPKSLTRIPFSLQFFIITIIFLIFDVEISIILPMIMVFEINDKKSWFLTSMFFMIILILGIFYEWNNNLLNWKL
uniref:NADH-ubiquinone oxidoreductase chain 3 n=1 Tax=Hydromanicus wulaianus TaxID=1435189 RepID=A0A342CFI2_9NEOP|nr:NADH dehydrogenase subunit 3 [Hydromanicus wulaianus]AHC32058.1 NADH dehydrogenase subunit 3 [Hydromanicus wulaianus]